MEHSEHDTARQKSLRRLFWVALVVLLVITFAFLLLLRIPGVATPVAESVLHRIPTFENTEVEVGRVTGGLIRGAKLENVVLLSTEGDTLVTAESIATRYKLTSLLSRSFTVKKLVLNRLHVIARQMPDSSWDFVEAFRSQPTENPITLEIELAQLRDVEATVRPLESEPIRVVNMKGSLLSVTLPGDIRSTFDSLTADVHLGSRHLGEFQLDAIYANDELQLNNADLRSARSHISARGNARVPLRDLASTEQIDLVVSAAPLALSDIRPYYDGVSPSDTVVGNIRLSGSLSDAVAQVDADLRDGRLVGTVNRRKTDSNETSLVANLIATGFPIDAIAPSGFAFNRVDGTIDASVEGPDMRHLSGKVTGDLQRITLPDGSSASALIAADARNGEWQASGEIRRLDASGRFSGAINTAMQTVPFNVSGGFQNFNIAPKSTIANSSLSGRLTASGILSGANGVAATATVNVNSSRVGAFSFDSTRVTTRWNRGVLSFSSRGLIDARPFTAIAKYSPNTSLLTISSLEVDSTNVGKLWNSRSPTLISGTGRGTIDLARRTGTVDAKLLASSYGTYRVDSTLAKINWRSNSLVANGTGYLSDGTFTYDLNVDLPSKRYTVSGEFAEMDVQEILSSDLATSNASGRYQVRSLPGTQPHLEYAVELLASELNEQPITAGTVEGVLNGATNDLTAALGMNGEQQKFQLTLVNRQSLDKTPLPPLITVRAAELHDFDIGKVAGLSRIETSLNVTSAPGDNGKTRLLLAPSTINGMRISDGWVDWSHSDSLSSAEWFTSSETGFTSGTLRMDGDAGRLIVNGRASNTDIAALFAADSISSSVTTDIRFESNPDFSDWLIDVQNLSGRYGGLTIQEGTLTSELRNGRLVVNELNLESNAISATGSGAIGWQGSYPGEVIEIGLTAKDLSKLQSLIPDKPRISGRGTAILRAENSRTNGSDIEFSLESETESIIYGDFRTGATSLYIDATMDSARSIQYADFSGNVLQFSTPSISVRNTNLLGTIERDSLQFELMPTLDRRRRGYMSGSVDLRNPVRTVLVENLNLSIDNDEWSLLQPAEITLADKAELRNMLIFTDEQQIAVDGVIDLDGEQSLLLTLENLRIGGFADLMRLSGLDGTLNGYVDLTGPADAPILLGELLLDIQNKQEDVGMLDLGLSYENGRLTLDGEINHTDGSSFSASGYLPVDLRLAPSAGQTESGVRVSARSATPDSQINFDISADEFASDWLEPFFDPAIVNVLAGKVTANVALRGTVELPDMRGSAKVVDGELGLPVFGRVYGPIDLDLTFEGNQILVDDAKIESGAGELLAVGSVTLSELTLGELDISISTENFLAVDNNLYKGRVASDLLLTGTTKSPYLSGYVQVLEGDLFLNDEIEQFEPVRLQEEDLLEMERVFGNRITSRDTTTFDFYEALSLDINVELERNTWLRSSANPKMNVQIFGDLDAQKEANGQLEIFGPVDAVSGRSKVEAFGKKFVITKGSVVYNGPIDDPVLDIQAIYEIKRRTDESRVTISLNATGTFDDLELTLDSDPKMDQTNILSYIAFGRPASETLQLDGGASGELATNLAIGQLTGYLEGLAGSELGLDVVEIEQDGLDTRLTAGKYIHPRVFLAVSQSLSFREESSSSSESLPREITLELEIVKRLLLRLIQREAISVNLLWQYSY